MTNSVMLRIGDFSMSLNTAAYESLKRTTAFNWTSNPKSIGLPSRQFLGTKSDVISLKGEIYPQYNGGLQQVNTIRNIAGNGEALLVVSGLGEVLGRWCIDSISEVNTSFLAFGIPRKIEFDITLSRFN